MPEHHEKGIGRKLRRARNRLRRIERLAQAGQLNDVSVERYRRAQAFLLANQLTKGMDMGS